MDTCLQEAIEKTVIEKSSLLMVAQGDLKLKELEEYFRIKGYSHFVFSNDLFKKAWKFEEMIPIFEEKFYEAFTHSEPNVILDIWDPEYAFVNGSRRGPFLRTFRFMERLFIRYFNFIEGEKPIFGLMNRLSEKNPLDTEYGCLYSSFRLLYNFSSNEKILNL